MNVQLAKKNFKIGIGVVGILGSLINICIASVYCFDKNHCIVGAIWFMFGICAVNACVDYISHTISNH